MSNKKESKQKKMTVRVDFTPMVDMLMLLITFFMLCTSLSKPSTMELTMPSNDKQQPDAKKNEAKESHSITIFIGDGDKILYGEGKPQLDNPNWLKKADWGTGKSSIRYVLQHKEVDNGASIPYNDMRLAVAYPVGVRADAVVQCIARVVELLRSLRQDKADALHLHGKTAADRRDVVIKGVIRIRLTPAYLYQRIV